MPRMIVASPRGAFKIPAGFVAADEKKNTSGCLLLNTPFSGGPKSFFWKKSTVESRKPQLLFSITDSIHYYLLTLQKVGSQPKWPCCPKNPWSHHRDTRVPSVETRCACCSALRRHSSDFVLQPVEVVRLKWQGPQSP